MLRNLVWGALVGSWAAFMVCAGIAFFSLFIGELRAELAGAEPRVLIGIPTGLLAAGVMAGVARPLLRRPGGEYFLGGLAAVGFFTGQFTVGMGLSWWDATGGPIVLVGVFLVGVVMTPLFRHGFRIGHLGLPDFDRFLDGVWHRPVKPGDASATDREHDQN